MQGALPCAGAETNAYPLVFGQHEGRPQALQVRAFCVTPPIWEGKHHVVSKSRHGTSAVQDLVCASLYAQPFANHDILFTRNSSSGVDQRAIPSRLMKCVSCQHDNVTDAQCCRECGERLTLVCPSCHGLAGAGSKFCGQCGTRLEPSVPL